VKSQFVLDASALLSILLDEPGRERVNQIADSSRIHAVTLAEVIGRLVRAGMPPEKAVATLRELYLDVEDEFGPPRS
jgi:PIN domain nuclease of toxin-antitoxin system